MALEIGFLNFNGVLVSWSHGRLTLDGDLFKGFTSLTYSDKLERSYGYGATPSHGPIGVTEGKYTPEQVKLKGMALSVSGLRDWIAARSPDGVSLNKAVPWNLVYQWDMGVGSPMQKVEITQCRIVENSATAEESPDPMFDEIAFMPMRIIRNGHTLYTASAAELGIGGAIVGAAAGAINGALGGLGI